MFITIIINCRNQLHESVALMTSFIVVVAVVVGIIVSGLNIVHQIHVVTGCHASWLKYAVTDVPMMPSSPG